MTEGVQIEPVTRIWRMCEQCAKYVYGGTVPPTDPYQKRVAKLLFMTAAHESDGFRARRQYGFSETSTRGGFGLWQVENSTIDYLLRWLAGRPVLTNNINTWLNWRGIQHSGVFGMPRSKMLELMQSPVGDPLCCALARVKYFTIPYTVRETPLQMAQYAKKYYNTHLGKAEPIHYQNAFNRFWKPEFEE
jgi:hypothetical protein